MRLVQVREQVEHLQLRIVARAAAHVDADEMLEAEVEQVEVRRQPHRHRRRDAVLRIVRGDAAEVVERLPRISQLQIGLRRFEGNAGIRIELRRIRSPPERLRQASGVGESLELHVSLQSRLELALLLHLLRREDGDCLAAHRGCFGRCEHRAGIELARFHRSDPRGAHRVARLLQQLDRPLLLAEGHEHLHRRLVLAGAAEKDGGHQRPLLSRRIEAAGLRRRDAQAVQQELRGVARAPQSAQHPRGVLQGARFAEQLRCRVALPALLQAAGALQGLVAGLRVHRHQSSGNSAARRLSDSGWLANFRASSRVTSPCFSSLNRQASRLCMPLPSYEAVSR